MAFTPTTGSKKIDIEGGVEAIPEQKLKLLDEFIGKKGMEYYAKLWARISSLAMVATEGWMVYKYYWPEWVTDTKRMRYVLATVTAYTITDFFTYDVIYEQVMAELTPKRPDLGIQTIKEAIPRLRAGHGEFSISHLLGYMGLFFFFAQVFYTVFVRGVPKSRRITEQKVEE